MPFCNWRRESNHLAEALSALSFRDREGCELRPDDGFSRWRDSAIAIREERRVVFFVGNGASASMASHFSADMAKNAQIHTQVFSDLSLITAVSNDIGFDQVFAEPLRRRGNPGDMLVAISSSGASPNIIKAVEQAKELGMIVVTLSAMKKENRLRSMGDLNAYVPADEYGVAETCHATILHYWMDLVGHHLDPEAERRAHIKRTPALHYFNRNRLAIAPLAERTHDLDRGAIKPVAPVDTVCDEMAAVGEAIVAARAKGAPTILMMGAHLIRAGMQPAIIDLMERGMISALCLNGAGLIHDYEFALIGATTESVARYIENGQFGLWKETGALNDLVRDAVKEGKGIGEGVGQAILNGDFPHKEISLFAAGARLNVPVMVHVGIGYDIVFEHPNCDGAAWGGGSYADFLRLAAIMEGLQDGVVMNFGSAVMAPEVYLKALAMARNVARQEGRAIDRFTTLVADLRPPPEAPGVEATRGTSEYYFRPFKTMLVRTTAGMARSYYVQGDHAATFPQLWTAIDRAQKE